MTDGSHTTPLRIGLVTCDPLPEPDFDEAPTLEAFARAGHHAETVAWNTDDGADLSRFDACLIRATWDYYREIDRFLPWIDRAATQTLLLNPPETIRRNAHKGYLLDLEREGVPIVPTILAKRGSRLDVARIASERGWSAGVVIKPAIGAGSWHARRFGADDLAGAQKYADTLTSERDAILQPVAAGFEAPGERSLIWIGGEWTHAIRKRPRYAGDDESVVDDSPPSDQERAIGDRIIGAIPEPLIYARLDVVIGDPETGGPGDAILVSELELIEPSLFFFRDGGQHAADAMVRATAQAVAHASRNV